MNTLRAFSLSCCAMAIVSDVVCAVFCLSLLCWLLSILALQEHSKLTGLEKTGVRMELPPSLDQKVAISSLEENLLQIPSQQSAQMLHQDHKLLRKKRLIDEDDELDLANGTQDESRMYALQVKVPELPNVDIGRILELYNPSLGFNSYEKTARKEIIDFVRTKQFQYALTKMDTNILYASFQITRGQFIKKLMFFIRHMADVSRDVVKATEILENCVDNSVDSDLVNADVLDEIDEVDEVSGRLDIRETLAAVVANATEDVIRAAVDLRKFFRNPDLRFGLLFRGLNYALKELTVAEKIVVILVRLKQCMKSTLRPIQNNAIDVMLEFLGYDQYSEKPVYSPIDIYKSIDYSALPQDVKTHYDHLIKIRAVEELEELHSFQDIAEIMKLGFGNDTNLAILLRTMTVQFMMSIPPDRASADAAEQVYKTFLYDRPMNLIYEAPKVLINEINKIVNSDPNITALYVTLFEKVRTVLEKYGPLLCTDLYQIVVNYHGRELIARSLTMVRMKLPQSELKIWSTIDKILEYYKMRQDYEASLPSEYNFADEFSIACRIGNIQEQYKINTISQIILIKDKMPNVFDGMRLLRQFPIRTRVILLLNRIDRLNLPDFSDNFKFQLRGIVKELMGDDEINEISVFNSQFIALLFKYATESVGDQKYKDRFTELQNYLETNPKYLNSIQRELILMYDYSPRRQLAMILREMLQNRFGLILPDNIKIIVQKCLKSFDSRKLGDEQFIGIRTTLSRVMDRVFSGSDNTKVTQQIIAARETMKQLFSSGGIDFKYLLRDVRLHKYTDRTQFLIILYRTATLKSLFTDDKLYKQYGHAVRTLVQYFGIDLNDIKSEAVDLPEEIEDLLEAALPNSMITKPVLRARNVLIKALETGVIDRRIAYEGIQCYARNASPKKKLEYIIKNIWPIRVDVPSEVTRAIDEIQQFSEIDVDNDSIRPINIYSFDFQEVFDEVIPSNAEQQILKAKEILYRDLSTNTGRYRVTLAQFERGRKYPILEIAQSIVKSILSDVHLERQEDKKVKDAAVQMSKYLSRIDNNFDRNTSVDQLLTGNAHNYV